MVEGVLLDEPRAVGGPVKPSGAAAEGEAGQGGSSDSSGLIGAARVQGPLHHQAEEPQAGLGESCYPSMFSADPHLAG